MFHPSPLSGIPLSPGCFFALRVKDPVRDPASWVRLVFDMDGVERVERGWGVGLRYMAFWEKGGGGWGWGGVGGGGCGVDGEGRLKGEVESLRTHSL